MIPIEVVCKQIYDYYKQCGYPGIGGIGDAGKEWIFVQAPKKRNGELPLGDHPIFINKETGQSRRMVFDIPDIKILKTAKQLEVPVQYRPNY